MANDCNYEMKIKGSKNAIKRVIACLEQDYNYNEGKPSGKHFFRVFDAQPDEEEFWDDNGDGTFTAFIWGYVAWSIHSAMVGTGPYSYYNECKKKHPDIFMGTTLLEQSQDCEIEVFSEEWGMCFSEHYYYAFGECLDDSSVDIDVDDSKDEWIVHNPNRYAPDEGFRFEL